jgi:trimeric autotransporter adhesin
VDVYVTAPDTELTSTAPRATLQPRQFSGNFEVPFGKSRVRLTPAGSFDVLMDSGELDFPQLDTSTGPGMQWLFAVAPSPVAGPSPVLLVGSSGRATSRFFDVGTPAAVRVLHASPDAPPVDVVIVADPETVLFSGLEYAARSPVLAAPAGEVTLELRAAGSAEAIASLDEEVLNEGLEYSAFLIGNVEDASILLRVIPAQSVVTESRLRFANVAPGSKFFSVYITASADEEREAANRVARDLRFGAITNHITRAPGGFFLTFTERFYATPAEAEAAEETVVFGPMPLELLGGDVLTWAILAPENEGEPPVLLNFDDRMP